MPDRPGSSPQENQVSDPVGFKAGAEFRVIHQQRNRFRSAGHGCGCKSREDRFPGNGGRENAQTGSFSGCDAGNAFGQAFPYAFRSRCVPEMIENDGNRIPRGKHHRSLFGLSYVRRGTAGESGDGKEGNQNRTDAAAGGISSSWKRHQGTLPADILQSALSRQETILPRFVETFPGTKVRGCAMESGNIRAERNNND